MGTLSFLGIVASLGLVLVGGVLVRTALLMFSSRSEDISAARIHSPATVSEIINGQADAYKNGRRDYAVAAGVALDMRTRKLQPQGRVSDELIEPLL